MPDTVPPRPLVLLDIDGVIHDGDSTMVKTGSRVNVLEALLIDGDLRPTALQPIPARVEDLPVDLESQVLALYCDLGGGVEAPSFRPGKWDLVFEDGLVVELDEELCAVSIPMFDTGLTCPARTDSRRDETLENVNVSRVSVCSGGGI